MNQKPRESVAKLEAFRLINELQIDELPVDPFKIAENLDILVRAQPTASGVSGMLMRLGNEFVISYSTRIKNEGFQRFSIAHELGHYRIPNHVEAVLNHEGVHFSRAEFTNNNKYEREADLFAANLLMPKTLCAAALRTFSDGLPGIESLARICNTSLVATAIRYTQLAEIPVAIILSTGPHLDYCFASRELIEFRNLNFPRKGVLIPQTSETYKFNKISDNVRSAKRIEFEANLRDWFEGERDIPGTEEVVGLGSYKKTLTILHSKIFADEEDEDRLLENSWKVGF